MDDDMSLQDLHQKRVRVREELRALEARRVGLLTELATLDFRIHYFNGVPRSTLSDWRNPILREVPKQRKKGPDLDKLTEGLELEL